MPKPFEQSFDTPVDQSQSAIPIPEAVEGDLDTPPSIFVEHLRGSQKIKVTDSELGIKVGSLADQFSEDHDPNIARSRRRAIIRNDAPWF